MRIVLKFIFLFLIIKGNSFCSVSAQTSGTRQWTSHYKGYLVAGLSVHQTTLVDFLNTQSPFLLNGMLAIEHKENGWGLRARSACQIFDDEYIRNYGAIFSKMGGYSQSSIDYYRRNAIEVYKNVFSTTQSNKKLYIGAGLNSYAFWTPPRRYQSYWLEDLKATLFVSVAIHDFFIEARGEMSKDVWVGRNGNSEYGVLFLAIYYRFSPKLNLHPKNVQ